MSKRVAIAGWSCLPSDEFDALQPDKSVLLPEVSRWSQAGSRACLLPKSIVTGQGHQSSVLTSLRLLVNLQRSHQPSRPSTLHKRGSLGACLPQPLHTLCSLVKAERHLRALCSSQLSCRADPREALRYGLLDSCKTSHSSNGRTLWFCVMVWLAAISF